MDLVIDERDSTVSSSKSGDEDEQDDDQGSPQPPSGLPPQPPTSSSRSSSYNQHSPDGATTPSAYNLAHPPKSVSSLPSLCPTGPFNGDLLDIIRYCERNKHLFYINIDAYLSQSSITIR